MMQNIKKYLFILLGLIALGIGIIGAFLPILPTTPLLLVSAYCFLKSSKRLYNWLIKHKIFGVYIYNYITYKAIPKKTKIGALIFLWLSLILSMILISSFFMRILLPIIGVCVSFHILNLKTLHLEDESVENKNM